MKKISIYIILLVAVAFHGCELETINYSDINTDMFPKTASDADALVTGSCYSVFHAGWGAVFGADAGMQVLTEYTSDIGNSGSRYWLEPMSYGRWTITELYLLERLEPVWGTVKNLSGMTLTIDRLSQIDIDDTYKNRLIAEVKCGRGLLAFMLYDFFGPLPLPDLETLKNPLEEKILPRATEEDMRTFIETGLLEAANAPELPYSYKKGDANYGRFTKGVAWMTLLKFYMQTKRWADAEAAGRELMKPEYGYDLVPRYKDIFTLANEKNVETIYSYNAMPENRGHSWQAQAVPSGYVANGATIPYGGNAHKLAWWFIDTYEPGDQRLETVVMEYTNSEGVHYDRTNPNGPLREQWGASALKYEVSAATMPDGWWCPIDLIIFRYADALTLLAEAIVRKGDAVTGEAVQLLNRVRTRAGLTGYTAGDFSGPRDFLDKLLMERAHELFYECGARRQDLIRDGSYVAAMEKKCQQVGETTLIGILGDNAVHFPLPQWVIDEGKGLILQNPGY